MAKKNIEIDQLGLVPFYKRRDTGSVKIRINGADIRVTMPSWMPYRVASLYVSQKIDWIKTHLKESTVIRDGLAIGKEHTLRLRHTDSSRFRSQISNKTLTVNIPSGLDPHGRLVQEKLLGYVKKVLMLEAEALIIPRVRAYAKQYDYTVNAISIKDLKSRWGSCTSEQDLAFSLFLIQLPWPEIDYVIFHELAHTKHMNHGVEFWQLVSKHVTNYKELRRVMKGYSPQVVDSIN